jgi:transcriptional regulator with XRE-family HTH domain
MTPSGLAHAVGVTEGAIRQMESGQTKSASFAIGLRLARVLGVTPWYLATGEEAPDGAEAAGAEPALQLVEQLTLQMHALDRRVRALEGRPRAVKRRRPAD